MNEIDKKIIAAQIGTPEQVDKIEAHMKEYFTRFKSYESKFTYLEWYNIFLDFYDTIRTPSVPVSIRMDTENSIVDMLEAEGEVSMPVDGGEKYIPLFHCEDHFNNKARCYEQCPDCKKIDEELSTPSGEAEDFEGEAVRIYPIEYDYDQNNVPEMFFTYHNRKMAKREAHILARQMSLNQHKAEGVVHSDFINFRDDLQVGVDRILRDKGMSNIDIWEAINATLETIREKYQIQRPNSSPIDPLKAREIAENTIIQVANAMFRNTDGANYKVNWDKVKEENTVWLNENYPLPDNTDNQEQ